MPITYLFDSGPYTPTAGVGISQIDTPSATFTVDLAPNYNGSGVISNWMFSDGFTTITESTPDYLISASQFVTDSNGFLIDAFIQVFTTIPFANRPQGLNYFQRINTGLTNHLDTATGYVQVAGGGGAIASGPYGQLVVISVPVPEPGTLCLLSLGLLGFGLRRRRDKVPTARST